VQQAVAKREQEIDHGLRRKSEEVKRYEPLEQVLAPRRAQWAAQGMDEVHAVKTLLAAQDLLEKNPMQGLEFLARSYGVNLNTAQPQGQPYQAQPARDSHPEIAALKQQLQVLQSQVQTAQTAPIVSQIDAFQNDPANLYFENVRDDMAVLLHNGKASDLKEAYEMRLPCKTRRRRRDGRLSVSPGLRVKPVFPSPMDQSRTTSAQLLKKLPVRLRRT
jgi:hypothetical protein